MQIFFYITTFLSPSVFIQPEGRRLKYQSVYIMAKIYLICLYYFRDKVFVSFLSLLYFLALECHLSVSLYPFLCITLFLQFENHILHVCIRPADYGAVFHESLSFQLEYTTLNCLNIMGHA